MYKTNYLLNEQLTNSRKFYYTLFNYCKDLSEFLENISKLDNGEIVIIYIMRDKKHTDSWIYYQFQKIIKLEE